MSEVIGMGYMRISEASKKWGISDRRIRILCAEGRIVGALKSGRAWLIPKDALKPVDAREKVQMDFTGLDYDFSEIDANHAKIDRYRPIPARLAASLQEKLIVEWTYNSNAIEGNTLTISETKVVLEGITVGGKSMVEHLETINHREAILYIMDIVREQQPLNEWAIRNLHSIILKNIDSEHAGVFRNENVLISGAKHIPPKPHEIYEQMQKMMRLYEKSWASLHPVVRATLLHGEFVKIHPFIDGNGRTSRLLLNFELMKAGYPPIIIQNAERARYYEAIDGAHTTQNYEPFIRLVAERVLDSQRLWLSILE